MHVRYLLPFRPSLFECVPRLYERDKACMHFIQHFCYHVYSLCLGHSEVNVTETELRYQRLLDFQVVGRLPVATALPPMYLWPPPD